MTNAFLVLPPVTADVAATALDLLPARLRKRVEGAVVRIAGCPLEATGEGVLVRVADDTVVTLRTTAGIVAEPADAVCSCLLAPACLHRAAVLSSAPLAPEPGEKAAPAAVTPEPSEDPEDPGTPDAPVDPTPAQLTALHALRDAVTAVLVTGVTGSGAVHRAELLHAAHAARLSGAHRPAATAVRIARRLGEARSDDPAFRLPELSADVAELLDLVRRPADALRPARRSYQPSQPLRLYGLFTEPVVTASGYAGATAYAVTADGTVHTLSDIAPGGPGRAAQAAGSPVPGGCALPLREFGAGGGVILTSPTVSPDGRIGGGRGIRSVRASGAGWFEPPLAALWSPPPAFQLASALEWLAEPAGARRAGGDLLFLDGTVTANGFAVSGGPTLRLTAPDERPELPFTENLRLLGTRPGLRLRLTVRLVPDRPDRVHALAASWTGHDGLPVHADLGLRRLNRSQIPAVPPDHEDPSLRPAVAPPSLPLELDLLRRTVDRALAGGRPVSAASAGEDVPRRLRAVGLTTGARSAQALAEAAKDRRHDALGRLLPADPAGFALAWLAAAVYTSAASAALLLAAWTHEESAGEGSDRAEPTAARTSMDTSVAGDPLSLATRSPRRAAGPFPARRS